MARSLLRRATAWLVPSSSLSLIHIYVNKFSGNENYFDSPRQTLLAGAEAFGFRQLHAECEAQDPAARIRRGAGVASFWYNTGVWPVSYTHLDVYKRQAQAKPHGWNKGHGHHGFNRHGPRRHYGWNRGNHYGWYKHRPRRHHYYRPYGYWR